MPMYPDSFGDIRRRIRGAPSLAALIDPYNAEFVGYGDSRTAASGILASLTGSGMLSWIARFVGNSIKLPDTGQVNYGIGGQSVETAMTIPRPGNAALGLDQLAAAPQAIVVMLNGTNSVDIGPGGTARAAMTSAIDYLTNPSSTAYPGYAGLLYQGKPKTLVILNELPRGINETGAVQNTYAGLSVWADWISKFSYDSGDALANPHVVVVNTYYDTRLLDVSSGATHNNKRGTLYDGLHNNNAGASLASQVVGDRLRQIPFFQTDRGYAVLPTAGTVGNFLNANPMNTTGTIGPNTVTTSGTVPDGLVILGSNTSSIVFSDDSYPGGKIATITASAYDQLEFRFPFTNGSFTVGDKVQMVAKLGFTSVVGGAGLELDIVLKGSGSTPDLIVGLGSVSSPTSGTHDSAAHVVDGVVADHAPLTIVVPPVDTTPIGAPAQFGWTNSYGRVIIGVGPGVSTLRLGPIGLRKV